MSPPCTICRSTTLPAGDVDFNKSGNDHFEGRRLFPESPERVSYFQCSDCRFMFTDHFATWSPQRFVARIYNADYLLADPPFEDERPRKLAAAVKKLLGPEHEDLDVLDYGGGNGAFAKHLAAGSRTRCRTYDPHHAASLERPAGRATLVTAFEVLEHIADQHALAADLASLLAPDGCLLFSTLLQPPDIDVLGASWWYACPRNAHMSFHTGESLRRLLSGIGLQLRSLSDELHVGYATMTPLVLKLSRDAVTLRVNA